MDAILERSRVLKQALIEFVLEAEGELAAALEAYVAENSSSGSNRYDAAYEQNLLIDSFLTGGKVGEKTPLDLFVESQPELPQSDRDLISNWRHSFIGLFAVTEILPDGFELMNWLTAKNYTVKPNDPITLEEMARFKVGEILLTRIAPVNDTYWMFSGPCTQMGNLGKPKLAVAIGNFKDNHKKALYGDAPELLEQAWQSVEQYHQDFVDFFGTDELTLPGYQLNKKIAEFQETITKRRLAAAGIDDSKSLTEIAADAGVTEEEMKVAAEEAGADSKAVSQLFEGKGAAKMVMPKVELPDHLKKAEQVTILTHPRWGQTILPTYSQFKAILESEDWQSNQDTEKLVRKYLEDPTINAFIWKRLAQQYPTQLEKVLQTVLGRPEFKLDRDLEALLQEFNKPIEPDLPEIASVPVHLHDLFQEALAEVNKSKSKGKGKKNEAKGFSRK
ncbi:MAG: hypothetical protein KME08_13370 [Aphanothece sp. CMT-3BRIN-NPC111]|nr:hypothetical protein [Aphanothece sp. CMT-3BRIN-NPC111]